MENVPIIVFFSVILILGIIYAAFFHHYRHPLFGFMFTDIEIMQAFIIYPSCLLVSVGYTVGLSWIFGDGNIITGFNETFVTTDFSPWIFNGLMLLCIILCILIFLPEKDFG